MAFSDAMIGSDDFDPQAATEDMLRRVMSDESLPKTIDPQTVRTRLMRKLNEDVPTAKLPAQPKQPKGELDFSSQAGPPPVDTSPSDALDFTSQVQPPALPQPGIGLGGNVLAAAKGVPHGAIEGTGAILQGLGTASANNQTTQATAEAGLGTDPSASPWALPGAPPLDQIPPKQPVDQNKLVKAGKATKEFAQTVAPMSDAEKDSVGGRIGTMVGGIAPYAAATALGGPELGIAAGFAGMAASTYGDVYENAKKMGASDDVAAAAAGKSALAAGVLGSLPLGAGKYAQSLIAKVASSGAAFATAGEAQEAVLQQIAKDYDPKAGYTMEQKRIIASLITGGLMGGLHHAMEDRPQQAQQQSQQPAGAPASAPGLSAPGAGAGPSAGASTGGAQARGGQPPPGAGPRPGDQQQPPPGAGPEPGGGPRPGGAEAEPPPAGESDQQYQERRQQEQAERTTRGRASEEEKSGVGRDKLEAILRKYGYSADEVASMSHAEMTAAVREEMRRDGPRAKPETAEERAGREGAARDREERDILKAAGWTDAHVNAMTPEQRAEYVARAKGEAPKPRTDKTDKTPPEQPTSKSDVGAGTREEPIVATSADDVIRAEPAEPTPAQAQAENYRHAHVELPQFGLVGSKSLSVETGVGQVRRGVDPDGVPWETKMEHGAYTRLKGTKAADFKTKPDGSPVLDKDGNPVRQNLDAFLGPHPTSPHAFIIDQHNPKTGDFDEHKLMLGYRTPIDALHAYANSYNDGGQKRIGHVKAFMPGTFKDWLAGDTTKPVKAGEAVPVPKTSAESGTGTNPLTKAPDEAGNTGATKVSPTTGEVAGVSKRKTTTTGGSSKPLSLLQFIASKGGLKPHPELEALDLNGKHREQLPGAKGFFGVVKQGGTDLDTMREAAEEAGYLRGDIHKTSTIKDLLDAIDGELRGKRKAAEGEELAKTKAQETLEREREEHDQERHEAAYGESRGKIDAEYPDLPSDLGSAAAKIMADEGETDIDRAVETAATRLVAAEHVTPEEIDDTFAGGAWDEIRPESASADGEPATRQSAEKRGPEEAEGDRRDRERVPASGKEGGKAEDTGESSEHALEAESPVKARAANPELERDAARSKGADNRVRPDANLLRDATESATFRKGGLYGLDAPRQRAVLASVFGAAQNQKVLKAIVESVPVDVMDVLTGGKLSAEEFFHNEAVFLDLLAANGVNPVATDIDAASALVSTVARASTVGLSPAGITRKSENGRVATGARNGDHPYTIEQTPEGAQQIIPGAEKAPDKTMAQRAAAAPLKPKAAQKSMDVGLFGDEKDQTDIFDHMKTVEKALGKDAEKVAPVDIARAAEIMEEQPGIEPSAAFGQAVIETAVDQGFLTPEEVKEAYGEKADELLESERQRASGGGAYVEPGSAAPVQERAGGAEEARELPSSGEAGEGGAEDRGAREPGEPQAAAEPVSDDGTAEHGAAGRGEAAGDESGDTAANGTAAEDADNAWPVALAEKGTPQEPISVSKPEVSFEAFDQRGEGPRGRAMQQWTLDQGRATNNEHLVAVNFAGKVVGESVGDSMNVALPRELVDRIRDPASDIVLHHNHPNSSALSGPDMGLLAYPGLRTLWAHGHDGTVMRANLTPEGRQALDINYGTFPEGLRDAALSMAGMFNHIAEMFLTPLRADLKKNPDRGYDLQQLYGHMVNLVMRNAGITNYQTNFTPPPWATEIEGLVDTARQALAYAHREMFGDTGITVRPGPLDRRPESVRHAGNVGTVFDRASLAKAVPVSRRADQARRSGDREDEGRVTPARDDVVLGAFGDPSKVIKAFKQFWTSTLQPELVSDRALMADPLFAKYKSAQANEKDAIVRQSEGEWNYWNKRGDAERIRFLDDVETAVFGAVPSDPRQAAMARRYRAMLDANWAEEKRWGSQASFVEDYFPHIWERPDDWRAFSEARSAQVGPTWFQKKRTIDYITDGLAAGLKLKYTNPVDIIVHRLLSGVDMRQRMQLLYALKNEGLSWEGKQGGQQLVDRGWRMIVAPDRKQWVIHPDVQPLWKNAVDAKGLWQDEHIGGSIFRGWMAFKNAFVPVKLAFSAFHPLHVLHINYSNGMGRAWDLLAKGHDPVGALRAVAKGFTDPMVAAPGASIGAVLGTAAGATVGLPGWGGIAGAIGGSMAMAAGKRMGVLHDVKTRAKLAKEAWNVRPNSRAWNALTPQQKQDISLMHDGGFVPQLSEQLKIGAKRQLAVAFQKALRREAKPGDYWRLFHSFMRRGLEVMQAPIFERWIPTLKTAAYLDMASDYLKRQPAGWNNTVDRQLALRAIAKSIDNRFGEMFYGNLFWNRYLKDTAIGSFLSLGWNLGFVREFGGAAMEVVSRPMGLIPALKPSAPRREIRKATNKIAFAISYLASAALINAIMSKLFSGENPQGMDFIFARIGGENPDGSPRRVTNMFYLREVPMLLKHIQERGGNVLTGTGEMIYNKMMFEPFRELLNNRDYYGYNIWDENAPIYKQMWQATSHMFIGEGGPMSVSGAKHASELSGKEFPSLSDSIKNPDKLLDALKAKGVDMSLLGFGPAPAYVEKSGIQNRISYLYGQHVAPASRPHADQENSREKMAVRTAIMIAKRDKDSAMMSEARVRGRAIGLTPEYMANIGKEPTDVYLFSRLPIDDQRSLMREASPEERKLYMPHANQKLRIEINRERYAPQSQSATEART